jgi:hypothetical protein
LFLYPRLERLGAWIHSFEVDPPTLTCDHTDGIKHVNLYSNARDYSKLHWQQRNMAAGCRKDWWVKFICLFFNSLHYLWTVYNSSVYYILLLIKCKGFSNSDLFMLSLETNYDVLPKLHEGQLPCGGERSHCPRLSTGPIFWW